MDIHVRDTPFDRSLVPEKLAGMEDVTDYMAGFVCDFTKVTKRDHKCRKCSRYHKTPRLRKCNECSRYHRPWAYDTWARDYYTRKRVHLNEPARNTYINSFGRVFCEFCNVIYCLPCAKERHRACPCGFGKVCFEHHFKFKTFNKCTTCDTWKCDHCLPPMGEFTECWPCHRKKSRMNRRWKDFDVLLTRNPPSAARDMDAARESRNAQMQVLSAGEVMQERLDDVLLSSDRKSSDDRLCSSGGKGHSESEEIRREGSEEEHHDDASSTSSESSEFTVSSYDTFKRVIREFTSPLCAALKFAERARLKKRDPTLARMEMDAAVAQNDYYIQMEESDDEKEIVRL
jgi:hypothetical protein